ncbi:MAG: PAS domain S-box protein [Nitrospirae bacterium]|nr:PAS domain S-box protein [Nitrospirota bacterium]
MATSANSNDNKLDLSNIVGLTSDLLCIAHTDGYFKKLNKAWTDILGYSIDEMLSKPIFDFIHPDDHDTTAKEIGNQTKGKTTLNFINRYRAKDGSYRWFEWRATPADADGYLFAAARDISERVLAETALRENEARLRVIFDTSIAGIILVSPQGIITLANNFMSDMFGYSAEEIIGLPYTALIHPEEKSRGDTKMRMLINREIDFVNLERHYIRKDGTDFWGNLSGRRQEDENGKLLNLVGIITDITERKKTEKALISSEKRFRDLLENVQLIAVILDDKGNITFCNDYLLRLTGWSRDEVINKSWFEIFLPHNVRNSVKTIFDSAIKASNIPTHYENPLITRQGAELDVVWDNAAMLDGHGRCIGTASIGIDVTEHRKVEAQLRQSQKMEAVGHLAGGVAHDFNNLLTAIIGYAGLLKNKILSSDNTLHDYVLQILAASQKAADLTQSLLAFSRKQMLNPKTIDINEIIGSLQKILIRVIGEDIELKVNRTSAKLIVKADQGQIEHALMNLATNARDAMSNGGILTITSELGKIDNLFVQTHGYGDGGAYAVISVSDTGSGMSETVKQHIFEPFFTTKEVGRGTGLGLAMVYGTVKQHNGFIIVNSEQGKGSTFKIYLPLVEKESEISQKPQDSKIILGSETILLIEDDAFVRDVTSALLQELGYTVIEANGGEEAKKLFNENKDSIELVISDVIMPGQSGKEVHEELLKIKPDLKILFISGYAAQFLSEKGILDKGISLISKPFRSDTLSRKIREVLAK